MEIKTIEINHNKLIIDIPEGMEIDLENSDLAKGIVKFKEKKLCFNDILNSLRKEPSYSTYGLEVSACNAEFLNALGQLRDIAKYFNKDWKPDWNNSKESKYYIYYNPCNLKYRISCTSDANWGNIYFRFHADAQSVIDNPKFRFILNAIYKE